MSDQLYPDKNDWWQLILFSMATWMRSQDRDVLTTIKHTLTPIRHHIYIKLNEKELQRSPRKGTKTLKWSTKVTLQRHPYIRKPMRLHIYIKCKRLLYGRKTYIFYHLQNQSHFTKRLYFYTIHKSQLVGNCNQ